MAGLLQPKREFAQRALQAGLAVPPLYDSFSQAVASGRTFLARSEHPAEWQGMGGVFGSFRFDPSTEFSDHFLRGHSAPARYGMPDPRDLFIEGLHHHRSDDQIFSDVRQWYRDCRARGGEHLTLNAAAMAHLALGARSMFGHLDALTYSYWLYIPGVNLTLMADHARSNRLFVWAHGTDGSLGFMLLEGGRLLHQDYGQQTPAGMVTPASLASMQQKLAEFYDRASHLATLKGHDLIEAQWSPQNQTIYFLQHHRIRDADARPVATHRSGPSVMFREEAPSCECPFVRGLLPANHEPICLLSGDAWLIFSLLRLSDVDWLELLKEFDGVVFSSSMQLHCLPRAREFKLVLYPLAKSSIPLTNFGSDHENLELFAKSWVSAFVPEAFLSQSVFPRPEGFVSSIMDQLIPEIPKPQAHRVQVARELLRESRFSRWIRWSGDHYSGRVSVLSP